MGKRVGEPVERPAPPLLTAHTLVLLAIVHDPIARLRDLAQQAGITERRAAQIIRELREAGYLTVERSGRRSHYCVQEQRPLDRFPLRDVTLGGFLAALRRAGTETY